MPSSATYRRWSREFLVRAQDAPNRNRKVKYLRLAVSNCVRARALEYEKSGEESDDGKKE